MSLQQLLLILKARYKVILFTLLSVVATTLVVSFQLPAQYTASTSVVLDVKSPDPIAGLVGLPMPATAMPGYMATQVDILTSDRVAISVVRLLKLDRNPQVQADWREATKGKGRIEPWLANLLQKSLDVKPSRESNVITINYKATDPDFAAAIANAFAQAYIDTTVELKVDPAKQYSVWFDTRSKELRERLAKAQERLSNYQQKTGIVVTDERLDSETQKLNELQAQMALAEGQSADASSKQRSGGTDTLPEVMQSGLIQQLRADIARLESKLQEMAGNLGKNHPQYQRSEAELAELKQQLTDETRRITGSIGTNSRISKGKIVDLRAAVEAQKTRILDLRKQRDQAMVLLRDAETAQRAYEAVTQRYAQTNLESQANQTNLAVLTPAESPLAPSSPRILLNTILAAFLGTMLGVGAALILEMLDRRVRSTEDIEQALGLQVLAELSTSTRRRKPLSASLKRNQFARA
jgi:succinoglycan biosynthesis transport protein ExoP